VSNEELTEWFDKALKEFDSGSFNYLPKKNEKEKNKSGNKNNVEEEIKPNLKQ